MNSFGRIYRVTIFGESHGEMVGVNIDGAPVGLDLCEDDFTQDLARRKSGARGTTPRKESDLPHIITGVFNGKTTGAPITILFKNENTRSDDYANLITHPRPGHSDMVAAQKYKEFNDYRGGGHFSGRITLGLVAAGVVAKKALKGIEIKAELIQVHGCDDKNKFAEIIEDAMHSKDSVGGIVECCVKGAKTGWGEPFFDSAESVISHAIFSIPAIKAIEFGAGFRAAQMRGSENNDSIIDSKGTTATNNAGGINGGITNGNPIIFRIAVKPTSSIATLQKSIDKESGKVEELVVKGRHDACIALRVPVITEAVTAMALLDLAMVYEGGRNL